jgi:hypothetical protein
MSSLSSDAKRPRAAPLDMVHFSKIIFSKNSKNSKKIEKNLLHKLMNFNSLISLKSEDVSVSNGVLILK